MNSVTRIKIVACPKCGSDVPWVPASRYRPFCSARCKGMDLGAWASDEYRVPVVEQEELLPEQSAE